MARHAAKAPPPDRTQPQPHKSPDLHAHDLPEYCACVQLNRPSRTPNPHRERADSVSSATAAHCRHLCHVMARPQNGTLKIATLNDPARLRIRRREGERRKRAASRARRNAAERRELH